MLSSTPDSVRSAWTRFWVCALLLVALLGMAGGERSAEAAVYGCAWNADGLANFEVGKVPGRMVSIRFRAEHSGVLGQVRLFFKFTSGKSGYQSGNGGKILIEVEADDGSEQHLPSGVVLASVLLADPLAEAFPLLSFPPTAALEAGGLYHLVVANVDPQPETNWVSIDDLYDQADVPGMQPGVDDTDLALLTTEDGTPWHVNHAHTPIVDIHYQDGFVQGQGYIDAWLHLKRSISGASRVRERFLVSGADRTVTSVSVRMQRLRSPKPLAIRLETGDGVLIEEGTIDGSLVGTTQTWVQYTFQTPRLLAAGQTYDVVVSAAPGRGRYSTYPLQEGTAYGFTTPTMFRDGVAQYAAGKQWRNFLRVRTDFDLQLFFTVAAP